MPTRKAKRPAKPARPTPSRRKAETMAKPKAPKKVGSRGSVRAARQPGAPMPAALVEASREADVADVPARTVLALDGAGGPEGEAFGRSVGAVYGVAYTLRFARKARNRAFAVGALEARWWAEGARAPAALAVAPREAWRWRLRMAVPADVRDAEVAEAIRAATSKRGGKLEGSAEAGRVGLERIPAARMGRILHVGPYADEPASFARIRAALAAAGLVPGNAHLEVYLSDPRRTAPARLRTVLLLELSG